MEVGVVRSVDIEQQMQEAYLDYAMSVIVSRALPDVRDGLKPVHRRILYAMHDMGLRANQPYKKSARIVGEVLGKYHPHGDVAVYDAMARMAQDFSMRVPLVDGQGNFGSIDGDPPAAMRYTEARMSEISTEILADIERNTVDFTENFDGSLVEPRVLPTRVPNFLVNGAAGIAVGMATSVPPHNLGEVCDALIFMLDRLAKNKEVTVDDLLNFIKGPDFPTGGIIYRFSNRGKSSDETDDLLGSAYAVGRGRVTVQAKVHVEEMSRNRNRLVITELPYQTNKANLTEKIAELARDGKIEGITDLRDESDRQGMRLVVELTRTVEPSKVLKQLFKMTSLQSTFSINMLALVDGEPRLLPLKRALQLFIEHRQEIITRRSQYELEQAKQRAHILEGLRTALDNLDLVIGIIRKSRTTDSARANLRKALKLSEIQA
ncbi:MAG: DNA gyrase subunit A, partial [Anaerolineae bacterium]|nr:DNA gyrase subunit A [Anaerolineae bacterium]